MFRPKSAISVALRTLVVASAFGALAAVQAQAQVIAVYQVTIAPKAGQNLPSTTGYLYLAKALNPTSTHTVDFFLTNIHFRYMGLPGFVSYGTTQGFYTNSKTNLANTSFATQANKTTLFQSTLILGGPGGSNSYTSNNIYNYFDSMNVGGTLSFVLSSDAAVMNLTSGSINVRANDATTYIATFSGVRIQ